MDGEMYESPAVFENLETARSMGFHILEPDTGYLASGLEAKGRLPESKIILETGDIIIQNSRQHGPLSGNKVLVTAGPTREFIDPVRFISNPSSGKMGIAMADAAVRLGADVTLLKGPVSVQETERMNTEPFVSAEDLFERAKTHADSDVIIMAAAVADLKPEETYKNKVKKESASDVLKLTRTPDILQWLGDHKKESQCLIGFAMETEDLEKNAGHKLEKKNLDWICANSVSGAETGFESDTNTITLMSKEDKQEFTGPKQEIAIRILRRIFDTKNN
jgi:phosphopantothenoylcysteine decarboxylase/phosphopantothenate--cysteine ligase